MLHIQWRRLLTWGHMHVSMMHLHEGDAPYQPPWAPFKHACLPRGHACSTYGPRTAWRQAPMLMACLGTWQLGACHSPCMARCWEAFQPCLQVVAWPLGGGTPPNTCVRHGDTAAGRVPRGGVRLKGFQPLQLTCTNYPTLHHSSTTPHAMRLPWGFVQIFYTYNSTFWQRAMAGACGASGHRCLAHTCPFTSPPNHPSKALALAHPMRLRPRHAVRRRI